MDRATIPGLKNKALSKRQQQIAVWVSGHGSTGNKKIDYKI